MAHLGHHIVIAAPFSVFSSRMPACRAGNSVIRIFTQLAAGTGLVCTNARVLVTDGMKKRKVGVTWGPVRQTERCSD